MVSAVIAVTFAWGLIGFAVLCALLLVLNPNWLQDEPHSGDRKDDAQ
jgi:hypothetical protein